MLSVFLVILGFFIPFSTQATGKPSNLTKCRQIISKVVVESMAFSQGCRYCGVGRKNNLVVVGVNPRHRDSLAKAARKLRVMLIEDLSARHPQDIDSVVLYANANRIDQILQQVPTRFARVIPPRNLNLPIKSLEPGTDADVYGLHVVELIPGMVTLALGVGLYESIYGPVRELKVLTYKNIEALPASLEYGRGVLFTSSKGEQLVIKTVEDLFDLRQKIDEYLPLEDYRPTNKRTVY